MQYWSPWKTWNKSAKNVQNFKWLVLSPRELTKVVRRGDNSPHGTWRAWEYGDSSLELILNVLKAPNPKSYGTENSLEYTLNFFEFLLKLFIIQRNSNWTIPHFNWSVFSGWWLPILEVSFYPIILFHFISTLGWKFQRV